MQGRWCRRRYWRGIRPNKWSTAPNCTWKQIIELIKAADAKGQDVARVHSGDPSLYGAIGEQIRLLRELGIAFQIIPGVTAVAACAALLETELTLPDIAQSVILTRYADKTRMPAGEDFDSLARHGTTMAIHLGVNHLEKIVAETAAALWLGLPDCRGTPRDLAGSGLGCRHLGGHCRKSRGQRLQAHGADCGGSGAGQ